MKIIHTLTIIILAGLLLNLPLIGNAKKRTAIMDFTANNTSEAYGKIVRNQIEVALYRTDHFEILERDKMELILKEQGFQLSGCTDTTCAVEIGKLLSVDYVVIGSIDRMGNFLITVKFIDIRMGTVAFADKEEASIENDIPEAINKLALRASDKFKTEPSAVVTRENKKKQEEKKIIEPVLYNPYTFPAFGLLGLSGISFGTGYYFNFRVNKYNDEYESLAVKYNAATTEAETVRLHSEMSDAKNKSDKNALYRNIFYGTGAGLTLVTGYFFYKFLTYTPPVNTGFLGEKSFEMMPLIFTNRIQDNGINRNEEYFFGGGVMMRF